MWRLYCRDRGARRFHPVDWSKGTTVINLIYATLFTDEEKKLVETQLALPQNAHLEFDWRKAS